MQSNVPGDTYGGNYQQPVGSSYGRGYGVPSPYQPTSQPAPYQPVSQPPPYQPSQPAPYQPASQPAMFVPSQTPQIPQVIFFVFLVGRPIFIIDFVDKIGFRIISLLESLMFPQSYCL